MLQVKYLFLGLVAVATISIFSSCSDNSGGYQKPDLSSVASGLHTAGTDTTITTENCNIEYVPVVGKNCSGNTVVRQKPVISRGGTAWNITQQGSSLSSDELVNRIKSVGYRIVPDRGHGYSEVIKSPLKSENSFLENLGSVLKWVFCWLVFLLLLALLLLAFWQLLRLIVNLFRRLGNDLIPNQQIIHPVVPVPVNQAQNTNSWQSENIQTFATDLQNIVKDAVKNGNDVQLNANSTANNTMIDLRITKKDSPPVAKQEETKKDSSYDKPMD